MSDVLTGTESFSGRRPPGRGHILADIEARTVRTSLRLALALLYQVEIPVVHEIDSHAISEVIRRILTV